ncbi:MAG: hypothetical protein LBO74_02285, partial [Candidatus Symbiothrix sp.]|nr:hypothetical protein [Candidatus Symbiothrix sp.]
KRTWVACLAALWLVLPAALQAQVHIGGTGDAVKGALLDLTIPEGTNLGLLPLNVSIDEIDQIPDVFTDKASIVNGDLKGLVVYNANTDTGGPGLFVWDGAKWNKVEWCPLPAIASPAADTTLTSYGETTRRLAVTADGGTLSYQWESSDTGAPDSWNPVDGAIDAAYNAPVTAAGTVYYHCIVSNECGNTTSPVFTVTRLASIPTNASYTITGATCYDVAQSGTLTGRTNAFASTHTMTYTFKYGNAFTDLSFAVLSDPSGIIESISSPTATSGSGSSTQTFEVTFVSTVESIVRSKTVTVRLSASYLDNNGAARYAYLDINVKDATCCAYVLGTNGVCYRMSDGTSAPSSRPGCQSGWKRVGGDEIRGKVSVSAWYAESHSYTVYRSASSGNGVIGANSDNTWYTNTVISTGWSHAACVPDDI